MLISLYIKNNFNYTLNNNEKNNVLLNFKLEKKQNYSDNDKVGVVEVLVNDKKVHEEDIYVTKKEEKSFFQKLKEWFSNLW